MPVRKRYDPFTQDFGGDDPYGYGAYTPPTGPTSTYTSPGYQAPADEPLPTNQNWNTDQFAAPGYTASNFGNTLAGWDANKWADPNHQTPKYVIGRILSQYDPSPENLQRAMAEITRAYPGTTLLGTDKVNIPGVGLVDLGTNFTKGPQGGGSSWWWGNEDRDQGGGAGAGASAGAGAGGYGAGGGFSGAGGGGFGGSNSVGADPFSQMIDAGIANFLSWGGANNPSAQASQGGIVDLIGQGGQLDPQVLNRNLESVREGGDRLRTSQTNTLRASLADRGLLAEPGFGSGPERTGLERIEEGIGSQYATAFRDIGTQEMQRASDRYLTGLGLGSQQGSQQAQNFLSGLQTGTDRQNVMSRIALDSLGQNMEWNKFLASFGLERDKVMSDLQMGRFESYLPLLQMFLQIAQTSRGGFV